MRIAACLLLAASPAFAQAPPPDPEGIPQHDLNRPQPTVVTPGHGRAAGRARAAALGRGRAVRRQGPRGLEEPGQGRARRAWKVENGYFEVVKGTGAHRDEAGLRRRAAPHRVDGARPGRGREPGPRQQRRLLRRRPLRGPGARQLREQDLPGRPGGSALRPVPAARERAPAAGRVAGLRHRLRGAALRRRGRARRSARASPSSTTASSCSTRGSSSARPRTRCARRTRRTPRSCRSACRTTATRSASATSGCAS